jgi:signal transduction histidine kinase
MQTLVEDVLALARQGRTVDETEQVALADVADEAWASVDAAAASFQYQGDGERVRADRVRLLELFENLFRNAVEHGGTSVTVTVSPLPDGFAVEDDGPGIPGGAEDDVFDRGFTSTEDGTGFGLAIVREIAEAHDWQVDAVATGGDRGARFEVTGATVLD